LYTVKFQSRFRILGYKKSSASADELSGGHSITPIGSVFSRMLSFIVPAHNEQACVGRTVSAIRAAARAVGGEYEIIVVDDASTDATADIARKHDATVVSVNHRQIAATRNAGGRAARGERLIFVDADTIISPAVVAAAMRQMDRGAVGGGATARFEPPVPLYASLLVWWLGLLMRFAGLCGGAFMFCTRDAFHTVGGFDERLFGAEDAAMSWALKREGRFVVLWRSVLTSGRRVRGVHGLRMLGGLISMGFFPRMLRSRAAVKKIWYESNRGDDERLVDSLAVQLANGIVLLLSVAVITAPLWDFLPQSWTPPGSTLAALRYGVAIFTCHVSLVLWPCVYFLVCNLFRQRRWVERLKIVGLSALCVWLAWSGTEVVISFWWGLWG
jgi:glycosyltransferase involved in cell wall biosynthesis